MTYIPPVNGGRINATVGGNTTGAGSLISSGTLTLAGGNNITLSQNGNAITISGGAGGAAGSNTLGISNLGNTSGASGAISGSALQYLFAGGNNVTLSQSINVSSATVTISAANQTVQTQNLHNMTLSGNTAGVMAQVSSGTLTLAGGNNITLSQNGNAVTIAGAAGGAGNLAISAAGTSYSTGTVNLSAAGGAITIASTTGQKFNFSVPASSSLAAAGIVSLSANGSTVSISAPAFSAGVSTLGNSAGNTGTVSNQLVLVGGSNITLSQSTNAAGATVSISGGAGGGGGGVALANSNTTYTSGTVNLLEGGGAITIASTTGQKFNVSVPATSSLIGTNGISVSTNGSSIYVDGSGIGATLSYFNPQDAYVQVTGQQGQGTLHIQPAQAPNVSFDRVVFPLAFSGATSVTGSATLSLWMGVYTRTSASLSLMTSYSTSAGVSHNGTVNSSQNVGLKILTMGASSSLSEGQYYVGILSRTTSATAGSNVSISQIVASQQNSNFGGFFGQVSTASQQYTRGLGVYSTTTSAIPSSVALSQLNGTGSMVLRQPMFYLVNSTF